MWCDDGILDALSAGPARPPGVQGCCATSPWNRSADHPLRTAHPVQLRSLLHALHAIVAAEAKSHADRVLSTAPSKQFDSFAW